MFNIESILAPGELFFLLFTKGGSDVVFVSKYDIFILRETLKTASCLIFQILK